MSFSGQKRVTVIVAAVEARLTIASCLARFQRELAGLGEVMLVDASRDGTAELAERHVPGVRVLRSRHGSLVPELWRDGLLQAQTPLVAFSTAVMMPREGWFNALLTRLEETGAAVVGGPIVPVEGLRPTDRAVFAHRYLRYLPPLDKQAQFEPAGDNALYRRDSLRDFDSFWEYGFWEQPILRGLRLHGHRLAIAQGAVLEFHGGSRRMALLRHRFVHGRRYGAERAAHWSFGERMLRLAAAPIVPGMLAARIVRMLRERGERLGPWASAVPDLAALLVTWSLGEAVGTCAGRSRRQAWRERSPAPELDGPWAPATLPR